MILSTTISNIKDFNSLGKEQINLILIDILAQYTAMLVISMEDQLDATNTPFWGCNIDIIISSEQGIQSKYFAFSRDPGDLASRKSTITTGFSNLYHDNLDLSLHSDISEIIIRVEHTN